MNVFQSSNILVTGGTGSIGSEIVRRVLRFGPKVVRVLSNDENALFTMEQELRGRTDVRFLEGDIRDKDRLRRAVEGIDFIFHAAALKHVPLCECNPFEAVRTNVLGTQNLIEVTIEAETVRKFITISTDKAVSPVNVMGATKLLAERLTVSANEYKGPRNTTFSCVRFGNVLDSRGSVVPLFREQISKGGPVTVTDPRMTRFIMSITKAVELVLKATQKSHGGEIFIFKMPALRISDLAEVMIEELAPRCGYSAGDVMIEITGNRAGEKTYEELLTEYEMANALESRDMFVINQVPITKKNKNVPDMNYRSDGNGVLLTKTGIRAMLRESLRDRD